VRQPNETELKRLTNSDRFDFVGEHRGMFSRLGVAPDVVDTLRSEHGIYMVGDSRLNIAGLNDETVSILADAVAKTI
jgi:aromatic-amino-acid transaminase